MRFLHTGDDAAEAREREAFVARVDSVSEELRRISVSGSEARIAALLSRIHPALDAEVLEEAGRERLVVITPRDQRRLRPLVSSVVGRLGSLEGVRFATHRPPSAHERMVEIVASEHGYDLSEARARAGFSRGHLLEVVVYGPGFGGTRDERAALAAERAVEVLLGERMLDDWVGRIDAEPLQRGGPLRVVQEREQSMNFPLSELPHTLSRALEGLGNELPDLGSLGLPREGWVLFEAEPEAAAEYAAQDDVALAGSALPEMLKCYLEGAPFSSKRFVRGGASIVYLKLDASGASFEQRVAVRAKLEDELAAALAPRRLGAVIGNGLGLRYAYIDLALAPGSQALAVVQEVARAAGVSRRSWILFCDTDLGDEWLGIWPESPCPPLAS